MSDQKDAIVKEAQREFQACEDRESEARKAWKEDLRFANADPDNGYQWDDALKRARQNDPNGGRPCLTTNKVKQHNRQITNDARQNKPSIRISPVDDAADIKTAKVLNGLIRHIEKNSSADTAYDIASEFAVDAGLGYWRVTTDYASEDSFEQEIYIKAVPNPLNVYLGSHQEPDGSDARCGFVFEDLTKNEFEARYPNAPAIGWPTDEGTDWIGKETIRICEYFKIVEESDTLFADEQGNAMYLSEVEDAEMAKAIRANPDIKKRPVSKKQCRWYLIAGDTLLETRDWPGKYIPIVRVVGEEVLIDGKIDRKGHTRALKDAQRMYNYWSSAAVEFGALQGKQPYLAPAEAIQGYEEHWAALNKSHAPYIPWNAYDEEGRQIPMPVRQTPPVAAPMYMEGMRIAAEEMKMASGQYDASMGARSNETSGRAILARQREGDNATFHFIDNVARAIKYTGRILIDLIPKIYDTPRVVRILGEDGAEQSAMLDPSIPRPVMEKREVSGEIKEIYNPSIGRYDVDVRVGPSYGTKRQEAFQALTEMSGANPALMQIAGDLVFRAADFPMAEEIAERLKKTLPPELQDAEEGEQEIPPQVAAQMQQAQMQMQQMQQAGERLEVQLVEAEQKLQSTEAAKLKAEIDAKEARAMLRIKQAEDQVMEMVRQQEVPQPEPVQQQPQQPPIMFVDPQGQVAGSFAPMLESIAAATQASTEAMSQVAAGQAQMAQILVAESEQTRALLAEMAKPRNAAVRIAKQPDGSFVGEKVEQ